MSNQRVSLLVMICYYKKKIVFDVWNLSNRVLKAEGHIIIETALLNVIGSFCQAFILILVDRSAVFDSRNHSSPINTRPLSVYQIHLLSGFIPIFLNLPNLFTLVSHSDSTSV